MNDENNSSNFKRGSRKRLTIAIDKVMEGINFLESPSPKEVNKQMTLTFREIGTMRDKIKKQDLNPENFHANYKYQMAKDKIKSYIDEKYNDTSLKDNKRIVEILQNRPLTTFFNPSQMLLFDSKGPVTDVIKNNKRKFGEFWEMTPKQSTSVKLPEISRMPQNKPKHTSPRTLNLSKLITKLMVKNLGIRQKDKKDQHSPNKEKNFNYTQISNKMSNAMNTFQSSPDEIIINDEDYFSPEYNKYLADVNNSIKVQKYIGQNTGKRRKISQQLSKINNI